MESFFVTCVSLMLHELLMKSAELAKLIINAVTSTAVTTSSQRDISLRECLVM